LDTAALKKELDILIKGLKSAGINPNENDKVKKYIPNIDWLEVRRYR
tara:strand:+ start:22069 stop:22209 length:141 start_codon:yes stop_codon:yes gene_type:complete